MPKLEPLVDLDLPEAIEPVAHAPQPAQPFITVPRLALGVGGGILLAWLVITLFSALALYLAKEEAQRELHIQMAQHERDAQRARAESAANAAARRNAQALSEQAERERQRLAQRAEVDLRRQRSEEQARKAAAWSRYFHPEPYCNGVIEVECVNASIRARRAFEADYAAGRVR